MILCGYEGEVRLDERDLVTVGIHKEKLKQSLLWNISYNCRHYFWNSFGYIVFGIIAQMVPQYFYTRTHNIVLLILSNASHNMMIF